MTTTPRWLLVDIDGTLSPDLPPPAGAAVHTARSISGQVMVPMASLDLLRGVQRQGIRVAWYTGREETVHELGLDTFLDNPRPPHMPSSWGSDDPNVLKALGLTEWEEYHPDGRYAVLDDVPFEVPVPANVAMFRVDPAVGLTAQDVRAAVEWLSTP